MKKHYLFKLIPPRPSFGMDMSDAERTVMNYHITYFSRLVEEGTCLLFGPVIEKTGAYGLAILEADTDEAAREIGNNDPSVRAAINTFEIYPMHIGGIRHTTSA